MKNLYIAALLLFCFCAGAQIISFPDANFKAKLLQPGVAQDASWQDIDIDANNDGEIEVSEVQQVNRLDVSNANISDLTGISFFGELKELKCNNNLLTFLAIDQTIHLETLNASHNALTSVDVNLTELYGTGLNLSYNNLTSFTIPASVYYDTVNLSHNQLTNLVIENTMIDYLILSDNNLSSIDVPGTVYISFNASFNNNDFSLLDLTHFQFDSNCTIYLGGNTVDKVLFLSQPGNINYSSNKTFADFGNYWMTTSCQPEYQGHLTIANCPNLEYFILKNGINHTVVTCNEGGTIFNNPALDLQISACPNLSFICVDEGEQSYIQDRINSLGLQNQVQVNSYCTFTQGGTYYTVNGTTRFDADANGCDAGDFDVEFQKFAITNGSQTGTMLANASGNYGIPVGAGSHTITPIIENPEIFNVSPALLTVDFPTDSSPFNQDFCITPIGIHPDLEISMVSTIPARPGFNANYKLVYRNRGNQVQSGTVNLVFDDAVLDLVSSNPVTDAQSANVLMWNFSNLQPFESREIAVVVTVNSPMETPAVNAGDILAYTASIIGNQTDETPQDNSFALNQTVVNSFDPNDKTCLEGDTVSESMIGQYVHYIIRFENTGTAVAQNIVVKDMIDTTKFDIATLIPLSGSHPFVTRITETNKVEFIFENINLPFDDANNDGYVAFKIKTKPSLVVGDTFSNTASIYFDYNFPIVTNTATTTIQLLGTPDFEFSDAFTLYPNPAQSVLNIESKNGAEVKSAGVYNMLGQVIQVQTGNVGAIDVSSLSAGQYFLKVHTANGGAVKKFVRQ